MFSRHRSPLFAVLIALLLCAGAVALFKDAAPAANAAGPCISNVFLAPLSGSGQLVRSNHSQQSRLLSGTPFCVVPRPVLLPRPLRDGEIVRALSPAWTSVHRGIHAGRAPPCFS